MRVEAPPPGECDNEGPVLMEPEVGEGEGAYRANCPTPPALGPRATVGDASGVLQEHGEEEEERRWPQERPFLAVPFTGRPHPHRVPRA